MQPFLFSGSHENGVVNCSSMEFLYSAQSFLCLAERLRRLPSSRTELFLVVRRCWPAARRKCQGLPCSSLLYGFRQRRSSSDTGLCERVSLYLSVSLWNGMKLRTDSPGQVVFPAREPLQLTQLSESDNEVRSRAVQRLVPLFWSLGNERAGGGN